MKAGTEPRLEARGDPRIRVHCGAPAGTDLEVQVGPLGVASLTDGADLLPDRDLVTGRHGHGARRHVRIPAEHHLAVNHVLDGDLVTVVATAGRLDHHTRSY